MADARCEGPPTTRWFVPVAPTGTNRYLRWRILLRMRRFLRPTLRRPLPRRRLPMRLLPRAFLELCNKMETGIIKTDRHPTSAQTTCTLGLLIPPVETDTGLSRRSHIPAEQPRPTILRNLSYLPN